MIDNHSYEHIFLPYESKLPISYSNLIQVWIDFQTKLDCGSESRCSMDECLKSYSELKFATHSSDQPMWLQTLLDSLDN